MLSNKEIFDTVVAYLRAQRVKPIGTLSECLCQEPNRISSTIGSMLANEENLSHDLLNKLQAIYDNFPIQDWEERLSLLSQDIDLSLPIEAWGGCPTWTH